MHAPHNSKSHGLPARCYSLCIINKADEASHSMKSHVYDDLLSSLRQGLTTLRPTIYGSACKETCRALPSMLTLKAWTKFRKTQACVLFCSALPNSRGLSTRLRSAVSSSWPRVSGLGLSAALLRGETAGLGLLSGLEASVANARGDSMKSTAMSGLAATT